MGFTSFLRGFYALLPALGLLLSAPVQAQPTALQGFVTDSATHEVLPFVNVFLANTTQGSTTDEAGRFTLANVPPGQYELVVSHVGYALYRVPVRVPRAQTLSILLHPQARQLGEVIVKARRRRSSATDYQRFVGLFLGTTSFSQACRIKNPDDVWVHYDPQTRLLQADASDFLLIENAALGYRIRYYRLRFRFDDKERTITYVGAPVFEEMPPRNDTQQRRWARNRDEAYRGSLAHFLRSVRGDSLRAEGFSVRRLRQVPNPRRAWADSLVAAQYRAKGLRPLLDASPNDALAQAQNEPEILTMLSVQHLPTDSIRRVEADTSRAIRRFSNVANRVWLQFRDALYVVYERERPDPAYRAEGPLDPAQLPAGLSNLHGQASVLYLLAPYAEIMPNGSLDNPLAVFNEGYWSFERVGVFLPLDYQPSQNPTPFPK